MTRYEDIIKHLDGLKSGMFPLNFVKPELLQAQVKKP